CAGVELGRIDALRYLRSKLRKRFEISRARLGIFKDWWRLTSRLEPIKRRAEQNAAIERRQVVALRHRVRRRCARAPLDLSARQFDRQKLRRPEFLKRRSAREHDGVCFQQ